MTPDWSIDRLVRVSSGAGHVLKIMSIDLFSLYVLFSHFRPRDATRGNSLFQMSSYARANVRITNKKNKRKIPMKASRGLKWENKMYKLKRSIIWRIFPVDALKKTF